MPLRSSFAQMNCSVARALDQIGDPWILLILREAYLGTEHFEMFRGALGIARKTLSSRLDHLVEHAILDRVPELPGGKREVYRLTKKGNALMPVLLSILQWGDEWISGSDRAPMTVVFEKGTQPAPSMDAANVRFLPGPGADRRTRAHLLRLEGIRRNRPHGDAPPS